MGKGGYREYPQEKMTLIDLSVSLYQKHWGSQHFGGSFGDLWIGIMSVHNFAVGFE